MRCGPWGRAHAADAGDGWVGTGQSECERAYVRRTGAYEEASAPTSPRRASDGHQRSRRDWMRKVASGTYRICSVMLAWLLLIRTHLHIDRNSARRAKDLRLQLRFSFCEHLIPRPSHRSEQ
ncbi:hypothetical protein K523DRAFT_128224 [Schizophyllum commune Tattone D]|nr:hypothetical protein K523DRAFT_128224 [Schizophyllum commune Tattone D]